MARLVSSLFGFLAVDDTMDSSPVSYVANIPVGHVCGIPGS